MSKAEKMRDRLANMQKGRSEFERQKKELEAQMSIGRQNIGKIQKGLKNNDLNLQDQIHIETPISQLTDSISSPKNQSQNMTAPKRLSKVNAKPTPGPLSPQGTGNFPQLPTDSPVPGGQSSNIIIPTGARISDWCFVGSLDSQPPIVKSRELYEPVRLLGRGSFGEVNLVKNTDDNKLFAIKTIFCSKDSDMDVVMREILYLRINRHPYVIDVHDSFITINPRVVHIVMHYCESGTLASIMQSAKKNKSSISETQIIKWTIQLALAMQFLHCNNTLHRDLKPMNVMLTEGGDLLKLADFGLALDMGDTSRKENFDEAGTPYYTAPEMIQRESYSFPADCWSFGIILHQLMALERPFEGHSTADLVRAILSSEPPPLPPHYSEELKNISRELLRKNQQERMSMVGLLSEPIIVAKLNNFAQSYRPRHLEERIRRSHTKQLDQQLEAVGRNRRAMLHRGKSEANDTSLLVGSSATNTPRGDEISGMASLNELNDQVTENHPSIISRASTEKISTPAITNNNEDERSDLPVKSVHIEPETPTVLSSQEQIDAVHTLHHSLSGHDHPADRLNLNLEHHHHHHQEHVPVLQKALSNIVFDANAESEQHVTNGVSHEQVNENSVNEILALGKQLSRQCSRSGLNPDVDVESPNGVLGGRKGAEIQKAIQQDQALEKDLTPAEEC